jgi:CheY-like chemotaxis protein/HPt (histidine-containing phosphotransfer) domain-containing protein
MSMVENIRKRSIEIRTRFVDELIKPISPDHLRQLLIRLQAGEAKVEAKPADTAPLADRRILVVDDNEINRIVATSLLSSLGCETEVAENGAEALRTLKEQDYDIVLMDIRMPVMDGMEATERIRRPSSGARNPAVPIIALTANAMAAERKQCLEVGMQEYLTKPVLRDALLEVLQRILPTSVDARGDAIEGGVGSGEVNTGRDLIDWIELESRLSLPDLTRKVMLSFREGTTKLLARAEIAWRTGDLAQVSAIGHDLKGSAANTCAHSLQELADRLETAAEAGDQAHAKQALVELQALWPKCVAEIERRMEEKQ